MLSLLLVACLAQDAPEFDHAHAAWTALLAEHVRGEEVRYRGFREDESALDAYLATLHAVTPEELAGWEREESYAFWINLYNATTVRTVLDHYPLKSILDVKDVFDRPRIPMAAHDPSKEGKALSLNAVEHSILRPRYEDARVHAAINCASVSCPPLAAEAFVPARLDEQLDAAMRAFVRDPRRNRIAAGKVSKVFEWFREDFERDAESLRAYLERWLPEGEGPRLPPGELSFLEYDWKLNDAR